MTRGRGGLEIEAALQLEERRQLVVLALGLLQPGVLVGQTRVLVAQGGVVDAQAVDLR